MRSGWSSSSTPEIDITYADVPRSPARDDELTKAIVQATTADQRVASGLRFTGLPRHIHRSILSFIPDPFVGIDDSDDRVDFERKLCAKLVRVCKSFWPVYHPWIYGIYIATPSLGLAGVTALNKNLFKGGDQSTIGEALMEKMLAGGFRPATADIRRSIALRHTHTLVFQQKSWSTKPTQLITHLRTGCFINLRTLVLEPMSVVCLSQMLSEQTTDTKPVHPLPNLSAAPVEALELVFPRKGMGSVKWTTSTQADIFHLFAKHLLKLFPKLRKIHYHDINDTHILHFAPALAYTLSFRPNDRHLPPLETSDSRQAQIERWFGFTSRQRERHIEGGTIWRIEQATTGIFNPRVAQHREDAAVWLEKLGEGLSCIGQKGEETEGQGMQIQVVGI